MLNSLEETRLWLWCDCRLVFEVDRSREATLCYFIFRGANREKRAISNFGSKTKKDSSANQSRCENVSLFWEHFDSQISVLGNFLLKKEYGMKNNATASLLQGTLSETVQFLWLREE